MRGHERIQTQESGVFRPRRTRQRIDDDLLTRTSLLLITDPGGGQQPRRLSCGGGGWPEILVFDKSFFPRSMEGERGRNADERRGGGPAMRWRCRFSGPFAGGRSGGDHQAGERFDENVWPRGDAFRECFVCRPKSVRFFWMGFWVRVCLLTHRM